MRRINKKRTGNSLSSILSKERDRERMNKRGFEMSFALVFSIIVGAVVIFLAIFATTRLIDTSRTQQDSEIGKEIGILLTPVETGLEEARTAEITTVVDTRIINDCSKLSGEIFGKQEISVSTRSGIGKEWSNNGVPSSFYNKYLFSGDVSEGKEFRIFVKPLEMPFKIADLIFLYSENEEFCFVKAPREVEDDVLDLELKGIEIVSNLRECSSKSKKVCFTESGCDIDVDLNGKSVKKLGRTETVFYESGLLYGAIFSSPRNYECQTERLMARASEIASLNTGKSAFLSSRGCRSERLIPSLGQYSEMAREIDSSLDLRAIEALSEEIRRENDRLNCKLF